jgi:hypothetical protein
MSTRPFPASDYAYPDSRNVRIAQLEAALLELNDENARLRQEVMEPTPAPVTVVRGHVLLEIPVPLAQTAVVAARGTARLLMSCGYAWDLAMELCEASLEAKEQRKEIEATAGNLPRTPEEDRLLAGEAP